MSTEVHIAPKIISYTDKPLAHPPYTLSCFKEISVLFHTILSQVRSLALELHWYPEKRNINF